MEGNRESLIQIKCENFKEQEVKLQLGVRLDFGKSVCTERINKIKELGIDPGSNAVAIVHEFPTDAAAEAFVTKFNEFKAGMGASMMGDKLEMLESIKANGKKVIGSLRIPADLVGHLQILDAVASSMGDFADKHQYAEFKIADSRSLKEIFTDEVASPLAIALQGLCVKLTLSLQKDLPIKIADFVCQMAPESHRPQIQLVGNSVATFHHIRLEMELREPSEAMKQIAKNEIMMGMMSVAQMAMGMMMNFGFQDVVKNGGSETKAMLCLSPMLSFELNILAPTAYETLEKIVPM